MTMRRVSGWVNFSDSRSGTEMLGHGAGQEHTEAVIYYVAPLVLGASFVGLCLVLRGEQRARRRK